MFRTVARVMLGVSLIASVAEAEDDVEEAQGTIKSETKELGKKAGVKPEVLSGEGAYGSAGCGLGSVIFEPSAGFTQVFAATTNGLFGNQTFGITSGTSNCDGPPVTANAVASFIVANRAALSVDVARGGGETIQSLGAMAQCQSGAGLGGTLQKNFSDIFPNAQVSDQQVSQSMLRVMSEHGELGCRLAG